MHIIIPGIVTAVLILLLISLMPPKKRVIVKTSRILDNNSVTTSFKAEGIENQEKETIKEIPDEVVSLMQHFLNGLKDPSSLQIYGDIYVAKIGTSVGADFYYNAKNGMGGYAGIHRVSYNNLLDVYFLYKENEDGFIDIMSSYESVKSKAESKKEGYNMIGVGIYEREETKKDSRCEYIKIDGQKIAEIIGCEFVEFER